MKTTYFTPDIQQSACDEFTQRLSSGDYAATQNFGSFSDEVANAFSVHLGQNVLFAHLIMGGEPCIALPFVNEATDNAGDKNFPQLSHPDAHAATISALQIDEATAYWALSIAKARSGDHWYGLARAPHHDIYRLAREQTAVCSLLRCIPTLHLLAQRGQRCVQLQPAIRG